MLPNFNPYTASSEPRQDLATDALALINGRGPGPQDNDNNKYEEHEDDFYADDTQNSADEGMDSTKVCLILYILLFL